MRLHGDMRRREEGRPRLLVVKVITPAILLASLVAALVVFNPLGISLAHRASFQPVANGTCQGKPSVSFTSVHTTSSVASPGSTIGFQLTLTATCATSALVDFEVYSAAGKRTGGAYQDNQQLTGHSQTFSAAWVIPQDQAPGAYVLKVGVFKPDWSRLYGWSNHAASLQVQGPTAASPGVTPSPSATPTQARTPTPAAASQSATPSAAPSQGGGSTSSIPAAPAGGATQPGAALPSDAACAASIPASAWEPRPDNYSANHSVPTAAQLAGLQPWTSAIGMNDGSDVYRKRISGNYSGTTDQILQWAACKWGIDPNIVRAEAVTESDWHQSGTGDWTTDSSLCPPGAATSNGGCYQSYGILQMKWYYLRSAYPMSRYDTAFNADFVYGWLRNCYEGKADYLYQETPAAGYPTYHAGDIWGCVGFWFSGSWYDQGAISYISTTKAHFANKDWLHLGS